MDCRVYRVAKSWIRLSNFHSFTQKGGAWWTMDGGLLHCIGGRDQDHPQEKQMQKGKMIVWGGLKIAVKRREVKGKGEKERFTHLNAEFWRIAKRDKKAFLSKTEENKKWERL